MTVLWPKTPSAGEIIGEADLLLTFDKIERVSLTHHAVPRVIRSAVPG